jgi:hypothetical protein
VADAIWSRAAADCGELKEIARRGADLASIVALVQALFLSDRVYSAISNDASWGTRKIGTSFTISESFLPEEVFGIVPSALCAASSSWNKAVITDESAS